MISEDERMFLNMSDAEYAAWQEAENADEQDTPGQAVN